MKAVIIFLTLFTLHLSSTSFSPLHAHFSTQNAQELTFKELWGYVYRTREKAVNPNMPLTDIAYFSLELNETGRLDKTLDPAALRSQAPKGARIHLVVSAPFNRSLLYWTLKKDPQTRSALIEDIVKASAAFDGVQIDFESVRPDDGEAYCAFLQQLKSRLPKNKMFSVALPARTQEKHDGYRYKKIGDIAERVVIMAYDEHCKSDAPGPIASIPWCQKIAAFAKSQIPQKKLVMGLPLYGRVWQKQHVARSLKYSETLDLWKKVRTVVQRDEDGTPHFSFENPVEGVVYYEDLQSLKKKLLFYSNEGIQSVAFWQITQEPASLWQHLSR